MYKLKSKILSMSKIISLEGNIGAGKTTLLKLINSHILFIHLLKKINYLLFLIFLIYK